MASDMAEDSLRWDRYQVANRRRRSVELAEASFARMCALDGATFSAPFLGKEFLASLGAWGGIFGRGNRTEVMQELFTGVLQGPILARTSKATFGSVFWGPATRSFASAWDGSGFDSALIDIERLRLAWQAEVPVYGAALPLHAAWLASRMPLAVAGRP
jgi:hypothetical protein